MRSKCPTCGRVIDAAAPGPAATDALAYRPFCSERCRAIDLGKWLDAAYRISTPAAEEDLDQGLPTDGAPDPKAADNN